MAGYIKHLAACNKMIHLGCTKFLTCVSCTANIPILAVRALHNIHGQTFGQKLCPEVNIFILLSIPTAPQGSLGAGAVRQLGMQLEEGQFSWFKLKNPQFPFPWPGNGLSQAFQLKEPEEPGQEGARTENTDLQVGWRTAAATFLPSGSQAAYCKKQACIF